MAASRTLSQPYDRIPRWQNTNPMTPALPILLDISSMDRPQRLLTRTDHLSQGNHNIMGKKIHVRSRHKIGRMALFPDNNQEINHSPPSG